MHQTKCNGMSLGLCSLKVIPDLIWSYGGQTHSITGVMKITLVHWERERMEETMTQGQKSEALLFCKALYMVTHSSVCGPKQARSPQGHFSLTGYFCFMWPCVTHLSPQDYYSEVSSQG